MSQTRAVIVGVNTYPGLPGRGLRGAEYDAAQWARFCTQHLRVPEDGTVLLTSTPDASARDLPGMRCGLASRARFVQSVLELGRWIRAEVDAGREATGIVVFAGHGASATDDTVVQGDRLALCMTDAEISEDGTLEGAVALRALDVALRALGVATRVTFIVDACYRTLPVNTVAASPDLIADLIPEGPQEDSFVPRVRLMLGAGEWGVAYESSIDGHWRGVFSFSLLTVLSQWERREQDGVIFVRGSYQECMFRARSVMQALGYDRQQPQLSGALRAPMVPFNFPSLEAGADDSSPIPDGNRVGREISGEDDIPGVWRFDFQGGAGPSWSFSAVLGGTVGSSPQHSSVTVVESASSSSTVQGGQYAMYSSTSINGAVSAAQACQLACVSADAVGNHFQVDLSAMAGAVSQTRPPHTQTHGVSWFMHANSSGPSPSSGPAFGPFEAWIASGNQRIHQPVWVQFHMSGNKVNGVQFWIETPQSPQGSIQFTPGYSGTGMLYNPGGPATWFHSDLDALIEV